MIQKAGKNLTRILATFSGDKEVYRKGRGSRQTGYLGNTGPRRPQSSRGPSGPPLDKDQCAYCKEKGHWARDCPKKETDTRPPKVLTLEDEDQWSRGSDPLPEPRVTLTVEGTPTDFLVDTGAEFSVLTEPLEKLRNEKTIVFGATGQKPYSWITDRKVDLRRSQVTHSFLIIPECPTPLLGRDLLSKLKAQISFSSEETSISWQAPLRKVLEGTWLERYPQAWEETGSMGEAKRVPPIFVMLKTGATPIRVRQYPMSKEVQESIRRHIQRLLELGVLVPCQSSWNTLLLPVKMPGLEIVKFWLKSINQKQNEQCNFSTNLRVGTLKNSTTQTNPQPN